MPKRDRTIPTGPVKPLELDLTRMSAEARRVLGKFSGQLKGLVGEIMFTEMQRQMRRIKARTPLDTGQTANNWQLERSGAKITAENETWYAGYIHDGRYADKATRDAVGFMDNVAKSFDFRLRKNVIEPWTEAGLEVPKLISPDTTLGAGLLTALAIAAAGGGVEALQLAPSLQRIIDTAEAAL